MEVKESLMANIQFINSKLINSISIMVMAISWLCLVCIVVSHREEAAMNLLEQSGDVVCCNSLV